MNRESYVPGPATGARIHKEGEQWTLVLVRDLGHPPARVWEAITAPEHLREWAPFDADRNLSAVGAAKLTTVGAPTPMVSESQVKRSDPPKLLEYSWGPADLRWELEPDGDGTALTFTAEAQLPADWELEVLAGWHIHLDHLEHVLDGGTIDWPNWSSDHMPEWERIRGRYEASVPSA